MAIAIMSCAFMFAQETIKISKIDNTSKGIDFGKKKDGAKDVIVITGHDLFNNGDVKEIENYTNSKYYIETVKEIRKRDKSVVIIAGACQSNFEALIASGANFASSPARINIHTFDPAVIAIRVATTSFLRVVELDDILKYIENGKRAFNGVETLGKMRLLL